MERPVVAVTIGDPASIGPEIAVKALATGGLRDICRPVVIGDGWSIDRALASTGVDLKLRTIAHPSDGAFVPGVLDLIEVPVDGAETIAWGRVQAAAGRAARAFVERAAMLAIDRDADAIVTGPIQKEALKAAGVQEAGHTELLASIAGVADPLTMFETGALRIFFLTRHLSLADALKRVTADRVLPALRRCAHALALLGIRKPRLAVAALNPHGGEHGLFGVEEEEEIRPAVDAARNEGLDVAGPLPADSVFWLAAQGRYDGVLSLFHDQGHIAAKMLDFHRTVSITLGLPFLRTSVDHGTAFDIAGTGTASEVSLVEAIRAAARYAPAFLRAPSGGFSRIR